MATVKGFAVPLNSWSSLLASVVLGVAIPASTPAAALAASADLAVTVSAPASVPAGSTVTFIITVTNNGPNAAQSVVASATLPATARFFGISDTGATQFSGGTTPPFASSGGTIQGTLTSLPVGASAAAAVTAVLATDRAAPAGSVITVSATATSATSDPKSNNNSSQASTSLAAPLSGSADVALTMSGPTIAPPGTNPIYTVTVANNGPDDAQAVLLTGATPSGLTFSSGALAGGQNPTGGTMPAAGGTGPVSVAYSDLAPGAVSTMTLTFKVGSTAPAGTAFSFAMTASSSTADPNGANDTASVSTTVNTVSPIVIVSVSPLPTCTVGVLYSFTFTATGGAGGYIWSHPSSSGNGLLPDGLSLSSDGVLSGTPTGGPDSTFTVQVTDGIGGIALKSVAYHIALTLPLTISTPSPLPPGTVGVPYSLQFAATGGAGGYTWRIPHGTAGSLSLSPGGVLSGTPTGSGDFSFGVEVTDSASTSLDRPFALHIDPAPLAIVTASPLPPGEVGVAYSQQLHATGGTGSYTWTLVSDVASTPWALSTSGRLSGTPTNAGEFVITVMVTDGASHSVQAGFVLDVCGRLRHRLSHTAPGA
jgi:large repetitive protein